MRIQLLTMLKSVAVARSCAKDDPGQWAAVLEAMPCVRALVADVVAASLEPENADAKEINFDIRPSGSRQATSAGAFQRNTPARNARLQRRAIVSGLIADRDIQHFEADKSTVPSSQESSDIQPMADPQTSFTRVVKRASPSSKREVTGRPKWHPTTCTAPGVTCGNNGGQSGSVSRKKMRCDPSSDSESPSLRPALRAAQPSPKLPKWFPLLCTSFGITCGGSGTSNDGPKNADTGQASSFTVRRDSLLPPKPPKWAPLFCTAPGITCAATRTPNDGTKNDHANHPADSAAKREARPLPMADARPAPQQKKPPKWTPTTCTVPGMTCGSINGVEVGATNNNAGADGAKSAAGQLGTGGHIKKHEPDAAAQVWSGPGRSIFTDDEGNAVQIEEDSPYVT